VGIWVKVETKSNIEVRGDRKRGRGRDKGRDGGREGTRVRVKVEIGIEVQRELFVIEDKRNTVQYGAV
jgi:hypothetical protein